MSGARANRTAYLFLLPFLAVFAVTIVVPLGYAVGLSFFKRQLIGGTVFAGLDNYTRALSDQLLHEGVGRVLLFLAIQVPIMLVIALSLALAIDSGRLGGSAVVRIGLFLPYAVPAVVATLMWGYIFGGQFGLAGQVFEAAGLSTPDLLGPGVMYYRTDVFDAAGVEVPTTWAEYATAAEAIHASDPNRYITYLDPGLADAAYMGLWQLDAAPWTLEGESDLTLDLGSEASLRWADYWDGLNQGGLTIESVQGSDEWFRQLGEGQIATWVVGAWGLQALTGVVPQNEGLWRVAPMPVWDDGDTATSQFGGSGTVVLEQSEHKDAATTFALSMNSDPVAVESLKNDQGLLPTTNAAWEDPAFLDEEIAYLGGQQARQVFAESARNSVTTWRWLPFQPYVGSVYKDTVGQAISGKTSLADGFAAWQDRVAEYAEQQGFTVTTD